MADSRCFESNLSVEDYYPFGMLLFDRNWTSGSGYRYAFNGKESDDETYGDGNEYDYGFRIYNSRIGKFLSTDPLTESYPFYSPYQFCSNDPVYSIDIDGLESNKIPNPTESIACFDNWGVKKHKLHLKFGDGSPFTKQTYIKIKKSEQVAIFQYPCGKKHIKERKNIKGTAVWTFDPMVYEDGIVITNRKTGEIIYNNNSQSEKIGITIPPGKYTVEIFTRTDPKDPPCSDDGTYDYEGRYSMQTNPVIVKTKYRWGPILIYSLVKKQYVDFNNNNNNSTTTVKKKLFGVITIDKHDSKNDVDTDGNITPGTKKSGDKVELYKIKLFK